MIKKLNCGRYFYTGIYKWVLIPHMQDIFLTFFKHKSEPVKFVLKIETIIRFIFQLGSKNPVFFVFFATILQTG